MANSYWFLPRIALLLVLEPSLITCFQYVARNLNLRSTYIPNWDINCDTNEMSNRRCTTTHLSMGLYEDEIDWDADLFGQIGTTSSNAKPSDSNDDGRKNNNKESDALADDQWDMGPQQMKSNNKNSVKSMREQMKQSWGGEGKKEKGGKPTADWVPRYGNGPDENEPWFTGCVVKYPGNYGGCLHW